MLVHDQIVEHLGVFVGHVQVVPLAAREEPRAACRGRKRVTGMTPTIRRVTTYLEAPRVAPPTESGSAL